MKNSGHVLMSFAFLALTSSMFAHINVININSVAEHKKCISGKKPVITMYTATWCGPCKTTKPHFATLADKYKNVTFCMVDIDKFSATLSADMKIRGIPTFIVSFEGKAIKRETGGKNLKELEKLIIDALEETKKIIK